MENILKSCDPTGDYTFLFNTFNGCSIKYSNNIFKTEEEFLKNKDINDLLKKEEFFQPWEYKYEQILKKEEQILNLALLIHENCNFRCTYCYEKFEKNEMKTEVMESVVKFVKNKLCSNPEIQHLHISWFGGEPLLNIKGIEYLSNIFIKICDESNIEYSSDITTNGYMLTLRNYKKLSQLKVSNYQITIDGPKELHDSQRVLANGGGTYNRIINNLIKVSRETSDNNLIAIRTNIGPDNINYMKDHIQNLIDIFGEDKRFDFNFHNIGDWGETCIDVINNNVALDFSELAVELGGKSEGILWNLMPNTYCYAGKKNNYIIGTDGLVYKCTVLLYDERNIIGKLFNGKLDIDHKKEAIWTEEKLTNKCNDCSIAISCLNKTCPASTLETVVPNCVFTRKDLVRMLNLMDKQNLFTYVIE